MLRFLNLWIYLLPALGKPLAITSLNTLLPHCFASYGTSMLTCMLNLLILSHRFLRLSLFCCILSVFRMISICYLKVHCVLCWVHFVVKSIHQILNFRYFLISRIFSLPFFLTDFIFLWHLFFHCKCMFILWMCISFMSLKRICKSCFRIWLVIVISRSSEG